MTVSQTRFRASHVEISSARESISAAMAEHSSARSPFISPFSVCTASITSRELPTAYPRGQSMSVMSADMFRPQSLPIFTISRAKASASSKVFMNAPLPTVTSRTMFFDPEASFLLMMLELISGMLLTVAVTSRSAYSFLSAGARFPLCPARTREHFSACAKNSSGESEVL